MSYRLKPSGKLLSWILLAAIFALPTAGVPQTPAASNASLEDTLNWLIDFLPTATGATALDKIDDNVSSAQFTANLAVGNTCNVGINVSAVFLQIDSHRNYSETSYKVSLADIDPSSVKVISDAGFPGAIIVTLVTKGSVPTVQNSLYPDRRQSNVPIGFFIDHARAQRAANAFQHAAQLCTNAQPF
jgi:hypothetical protein